MLDQGLLSRFLFKENQYCANFLIHRDFVGELDQILHDSQPIPQQFWQKIDYVDDFERIKNTDAKTTLEMIETNSPVLLNKDLASIALHRMGHFEQKRMDKICGMVTFSEEKPEKNFEALFAVAHWKNWSQPVSQWLHWETFFELIELSLNFPQYRTWGAYSFIWSLVKNGGQVSSEDNDYLQIVSQFKNILTNGLDNGDSELETACAIALGQLKNLEEHENFADMIGKSEVKSSAVEESFK